MWLLVICILGHVERDPLACHLTNEKLESVCYVLAVLLKFHSIPIKDHPRPLRSAVCLELVIPGVIRIAREPRFLNTETSVWESEENRRSTSFDRSTIDLP